MEDSVRNVCRIARTMAGQTQERFAEAIDVSVESIRLYESGRAMPSDDVVTRMAEVSGHQIICYWHLLNKSRVAAELLPEVADMPLEQAVLRLVRRIGRFEARHRGDALMEIAEDGRVDALEAMDFDTIMGELAEIVQAAMTLKFTQGRGRYEHSYRA